MTKILSVATMALMLGACSGSRNDRMIAGALIGGGTGAVIGGVATGSIPGALIGGAIGAAGGAAIGALTAPQGY
jgi:osmotically inducible lipoprotein OsmB